MDTESYLNIDAAYVPVTDMEIAIARRMIELSFRLWPTSETEVWPAATVDEYIGDGLFRITISTGNPAANEDGFNWLDMDAIIYEHGVAWVQMNHLDEARVGIEMDTSDYVFDGENGVPVSGAVVPPVAENAKDLIGVAEAAAEYGVPYQTAVSARKSGKLAARRIGRNWVTTRAAFKAWVEGRRGTESENG